MRGSHCIAQGTNLNSLLTTVRSKLTLDLWPIHQSSTTRVASVPRFVGRALLLAHKLQILASSRSVLSSRIKQHTTGRSGLSMAHQQQQSPLLAFNDVDLQQLARRDAAAAVSPDPSIPATCWARCLADPLPDPSVHKPARPPLLEAISLLPIGYRVGRYLRHERSAGRDPIFDLNGPLMLPPMPGKQRRAVVEPHRCISSKWHCG